MKDLIEELGRKLLEEAIASPTAGDGAMDEKSKVDIFKATSLWYLGLNKRTKGDDDPPPDGTETFDRIAKRLNGKGVVQ